jgi:hypothetical protein
MSGETAESISAWTIDSLKEATANQITALGLQFQQQIDDLRSLLDERYETQTAANRVAFDAAEKAVQTALLSAEKAVVKAEVAADKRFDAVNEFRGQLNDQAQTFMPRAEADTRLMSLTEKIDTGLARNVERIRSVELRLETQPTHAETQLATTRINDMEVRMQGLISRAEIDTLNNSSISRTTGITERITALELSFTKRLEHGAGEQQGTAAGVVDRRASANLIIAVLGAVIAALFLALGIYAAVKP